MPVEEWVAGQASPLLRPFVAGYCGYRQAGLAPSRHRGLPSPYLTLIFTLDDPLHVAEHPDPAQPAATYDALVGGLHTRPALVTHGGSQSGVQVALSPLGARALLGVPAGQLAGADLPADAVLGRFAGQVLDRIRAAPAWAERMALLDAALADRLAGEDRPAGAARARVRPDVAMAWRRIVRSGGTVTVRDLAAEAGCSARHLGELFRREIGLSPKQAARVVRFDRARRLLQALRWPHPPGPGAVAQCAAACGYYDQSHLDRDFRELAGAAPARWLAEELRNVQVPPPQVLAGSGP